MTAVLTKEQLKDFKMQSFVINKLKGGFTVSSSTAAVMTEVAKYQIPRGIHIFLPKGFMFHLSLYDASTTPVLFTTGSFLIRKEDPSETNIQEVASGIVEMFGGKVYSKLERPEWDTDHILLTNTILRVLVNTATICSGTNSKFTLKAIALIPKRSML